MKFSYIVFVVLSFIFSLVSNGDILTKLNVKYGISETPTNTMVWVSFKRHKAFGNPPYDTQVDRIKSDSYVNLALASYYNASKINTTGLACESVKYENDIVTFKYSCASVRVVEVIKNRECSSPTQSQNQVLSAQAQKEVKTQPSETSGTTSKESAQAQKEVKTQPCLEKPVSQKNVQTTADCTNEEVKKPVKIASTSQVKENLEEIAESKLKKPQETQKEDSSLSETKLNTCKINHADSR